MEGFGLRAYNRPAKMSLGLLTWGLGSLGGGADYDYRRVPLANTNA